MFVRFRDLAQSRVIRNHLGLTMDEWDDLPETFQRWAPHFYKLEADLAKDDNAHSQRP